MSPVCKPNSHTIIVGAPSNWQGTIAAWLADQFRAEHGERVPLYYTHTDGVAALQARCLHAPQMILKERCAVLSSGDWGLDEPDDFSEAFPAARIWTCTDLKQPIVTVRLSPVSRGKNLFFTALNGRDWEGCGAPNALGVLPGEPKSRARKHLELVR